VKIATQYQSIGFIPRPRQAGQPAIVPPSSTRQEDDQPSRMHPLALEDQSERAITLFRWHGTLSPDLDP
jgi:hypothetical protein